MIKQLKYLSIPLFALLLFISCNNSTESFVPELKDVKIIKPSEGEIYYSNSIGMIKWSYPEIIKSVSIQYTTDKTPFWKDLVMDTTIISGEYLWDVPNEYYSSATIKLTVMSENEKRDITQNFIIQTGLQIVEPEPFQVFSNPTNVTIKWKVFGNYSKYKLYYSKFNVYRTSNWNLIADNIDGTLNEYQWKNPSVYSNEVKIKLVAFHNQQEAVVESDTVFTIYCDSLLFQHRKFLRKLGVGNVWVYKITNNNLWSEGTIYYSIHRITDSKIENGITLFKEIIETYKDTLSLDTVWVESRESYTPSLIMNDGDRWFKDYGYLYYNKKCKESSEEVLGLYKKVKKYEWLSSGSGISSGNYAFAVDFGIYSDFHNAEGFTTLRELMGVFIDGIVYGDTTIVK